MGKVVHLSNPFDPLKRDIHDVRKPMTVRRFVSRRRELRRHTSVRRIGGLHGGRRVREFDRPTVCIYNGRPLKRSEWSKVTIGEGDLVVFNTLPGLGGGAGGAVLGIVLAIAIAVAAPYLAGIVAPMIGVAMTTAAGTLTLGGSLLTAGIGIALSMAAMGLMSLFSPAPAAASQMNSAYGGTGGVAAQTSPTYSLQAQGNTARLGQPIPVLHGRHMVYPDYVTLPYSRYVDNEQYIHALLCVTQGRCGIEAVRIGDTPIASFEEIVWQKVEPGALPDAEIVDARWLVCRDLAQIELPDSAAGSTWKGPFAINPAGTIVDSFEFDLIAPRGLYKYTNTGAFDARSFTVEIEVQEIDDTGAAVGDPDEWEPYDPIVKTAAANEPQRYTEALDLPGPGRWQARTRRTDAKDTETNAGHQVDWAGLRGKLTSERRFMGITCLAVRMKATGDLNSQTSRQVNCIATRWLPTWDPEAGAMTASVSATRSLCDAFADIALNERYGAKQPESKVDLAGLYAWKEEFDGLGWSFDFLWDQSVTQWEALGRVARACGGVQVVQGGKIRLVRDVATTAPVMMFTPRNIRQGSLQIEYKMVDDQTADAVIGTFIDPNSWKPVTLTEAFDDSPQANPTTVQYHGVTHRGQLRFCLWLLLRANRYRRRVVGWGTEMEGLPLLYGDPVALSHDMPAWGQAAEATAWDAGTRTLTLTEEMVFTEGASHYVAIRKPNGTMAGPFEATDGGDHKIIVGAGTLPTIYTGGDRERTIIQFGPGETYAKRLKVISMQPRDEWTAELLAIDDDPRMYDPVPPEPEVVPPIGAPTDPLDIHVTANAAHQNLRTIANNAGYTGNLAQQVTIWIDAGVEIYSTSISIPALIRGTWPPGMKPILKNRGRISGAGGAGAAGGIGSSGEPGGAALDASTGKLTVDNTDGVIRGGGGGGGGGGNSDINGGGGGGGGAGFNNAPGGPGYSTGSNGNPGSSAGPGTGTNGGSSDVYVDLDGDPETSPTYDHTSTGGTGGNGGGWGQPGSPGTNGSPFGTGYGNGGAAGYAVRGNSKITWTAVGTRTGPIA